MAAERTSAGSLKIKFPLSDDHLRRIEIEDGVSIYHMYPTLADWVGKQVSDEVNPRSHDEDAVKGSVPKKIDKTLREYPEDFFLANRGETILAASVKYDKEKQTAEILFDDFKGPNAQQGVADGGTTDAVIASVQREVASGSNKDFTDLTIAEIPKFLRNARVHLEVFVGLDDRERIARLVEGRNTSRQVKPWTMSYFKGKFDWIEDILQKQSGSQFKDRIGFEENASADATVLDVIAVMTLFHEAYNQPGRAPTIAYSAKGTLDQRLIDAGSADGYLKLASILPDILRLHDYVYANFNSKYQEVIPGGRLGRRGPEESRTFPAARRKLPFTGKESSHTIPTGALFPVLASLRALVGYKKSGDAYWRVDPFDFFDKNGSTIISGLLDHMEAHTDNPTKLGKDKTLYTGLFNQVLLIARE